MQSKERIIWYEYDENGKLKQKWANSLPSGRYVEREGKMVRISDRPMGATHYSASDNLGGITGLVNPADGKRYDSRSLYTRAVKAAGCEIVGNDIKTPTKPREVRGDFNVRKELKQAVHKVLG